MGEKKMFDYEAVAHRYGIDQNTLDQIIKDLYIEFPGDEMMVELHAVRVIKTLSKQVKET